MLGSNFTRFFEEVEGTEDLSEIRAYMAAIKDCAPNVSTVNKKSSYFKESHFTVFLVDPVLRDEALYDKYCSTSLGHLDIDMTSRGVSADPAMIIKDVKNKDEARSYAPKSDFLLNTSYVPVIINETISHQSQSDRCRMLLQAAVYARVGNSLRTGRDLVILCFYLNTKFEAERYVVYQLSTTDTVCEPVAMSPLS
jgi:hypothetical protein